MCMGHVGPLGCDVEGAYLEFTEGGKGWKCEVGTHLSLRQAVSTEVDQERKTCTWCLYWEGRSVQFGELRVSRGAKGDRGQERRKDKPKKAELGVPVTSEEAQRCSLPWLVSRVACRV